MLGRLEVYEMSKRMNACADVFAETASALVGHASGYRFMRMQRGPMSSSDVRVVEEEEAMMELTQRQEALAAQLNEARVRMTTNAKAMVSGFQFFDEKEVQTGIQEVDEFVDNEIAKLAGEGGSRENEDEDPLEASTTSVTDDTSKAKKVEELKARRPEMINSYLVGDDPSSLLNNGKDETETNEEEVGTEKKSKKPMTKAQKMWGALPAGFQKLTSKKPGKGLTPKVMTFKNLMKTIVSILNEKRDADLVDDKCGNKRQSIHEFCYDYCLNKYGLKSLADNGVYGLIESLKSHLENPKVRLFARFLGYGAAGRILGEESMELYLSSLEAFRSKTLLGGITVCQTENEQKDWFTYASLDICKVMFERHGLKSQLPDDYPARLRSKLAVSAKKETLSAMGAKIEAELIDYDHWFTLCEEEMHDHEMRTYNQLRTLFTAADVNQDGVLNLSEFQNLVKEVDSSKGHREVLRMYNECLQEEARLHPNNTDPDVLSPNAFAEVASHHSLHGSAEAILTVVQNSWAEIQEVCDKFQEKGGDAFAKERDGFKDAIQYCVEEMASKDAKSVDEKVKELVGLYVRIVAMTKSKEQADKHNPRNSAFIRLKAEALAVGRLNANILANNANK